MWEQLKAIVGLAGTLILMVLVFVGAYYASKFVGKGARLPGVNGGENVEILSSTLMGRDRSLVVVRVAGKVLLLGVTAQQIQKVEELDPALFSDVSKGTAPPPDFMSYLKVAWKQRTDKQDKEGKTHE